MTTPKASLEGRTPLEALAAARSAQRKRRPKPRACADGPLLRDARQDHFLAHLRAHRWRLEPPPRNFKSLPLGTKSVAASRLYRLSRFASGEPYFGRSAGNRFDDRSRPKRRRFGTCYCGFDLSTAIAETLLHLNDRPAIAAWAGRRLGAVAAVDAPLPRLVTHRRRARVFSSIHPDSPARRDFCELDAIGERLLTAKSLTDALRLR